MRREIYPLARRLATRLTQEHHARRRGPLDFRRTVRASISTGGVPLTTHHRPKRPHRTELVVLCDVSGSVANFAQFTLLLVFALRDQFQKVRAFTFIDHVHEVTDHFRPGADVADVMADLAASTSHAALWGRTNYGRAFTKFAEQYADALGPRSSLLILGDARSNYSDLSLPVLRDLAGSARHAWWLNPEHTRHWDTGDSAAGPYGEVVPMVECRNLTQLGEFVHDILEGRSLFEQRHRGAVRIDQRLAEGPSAVCVGDDLDAPWTAKPISCRVTMKPGTSNVPEPHSTRWCVVSWNRSVDCGAAVSLSSTTNTLSPGIWAISANVEGRAPGARCPPPDRLRSGQRRRRAPRPTRSR